MSREISARSLKLNKDREEIVMKFKDLVDKANTAIEAFKGHGGTKVPNDMLFALRVSSINLLTRLASGDSIYVREFQAMPPGPHAIKGVLEAARDDYLQGFMTDHRLLVSAEVFSDFLVQAEVLLDHDYLVAAAVTIRAVLEDALRRLCEAHKVEVEKRDTISNLNEKLYKKEVITKLQLQEIIAKAELGNSAAHGRFHEVEGKKEDVEAFLEFVLRFLAQKFT